MLSSHVDASSSVVPRSWGASRRLAAAPISLWQLGDKQLGGEQATGGRAPHSCAVHGHSADKLMQHEAALRPWGR